VKADLTSNETGKSSRTVANKAIDQSIANGVNSVDQTFNTALDSIQKIGNTAKNIVPTAALQSVTSATNTLDAFKENTNNVLEKNKIEAQNQIDALNNAKNISNNTAPTNGFQKPFEYVKLFFFTVLTGIFKYKVVFYGLLVIIVLLLVRYIWHLIF
jgi:hypothetical protein